MDEKGVVVKMKEFEYVAKEPEGFVPAKNIMRVHANLDQSQDSKSSSWVVFDTRIRLLRCLKSQIKLVQHKMKMKTFI